MLVQVIQGRVKDPDLLLRQMDRWIREIKPGAQGFLGSTGGVTADGRAVWIARFESSEAAAQNSNRREQDAWWNETVKAFDEAPTFRDCTEVDQFLGGGSDDAGFVQVVQGRAKDAAHMRAAMRAGEEELRRQRPDILGGLIAWHPDGEFTQVVYFRSEADARQQERAAASSELARGYQDMIDGEPAFYDLPDPRMT